MSHTKGPWEVFETLDSQKTPIELVVKSSGVDIASIELYRDKTKRIPQYDNARLIAAAPDMFEALEVTYSMLPEGVHKNAIRALILKARGQG